TDTVTCKSQENNPNRRPALKWCGKGWAPQLVQRFLGERRPWQEIEGFYTRLVAGNASLLDLESLQKIKFTEAAEQTLSGLPGPGGSTQQERQPTSSADSSYSISRRKETQHTRLTYAVTICFFGPAFAGWAWAPGLSGTAQGTVQDAVAKLFGPDKNTQVVVNAAGRTDRGVSAYGQVVSFYSWEELALDDIITCINAADPGKLRALHAQVVPRSFHATFQAVWRRYIYLLPLRSRPVGGVPEGPCAPVI
ncbi:pseudouridine synthase, partial [Coccomyxa subellipsoidea C-169]